MRITQTVLVALAAWLVGTVAAHGQTPIVVAPGASITVAWDAPDAHAGTAPTGYRFETFRESASGVVVTTTDVPLAVTQATVPATALPQSGSYLLAVRAYNAAGVSPRSNALPFAVAGVPLAPGNLRLAPQ